MVLCYWNVSKKLNQSFTTDYGVKYYERTKCFCVSLSVDVNTYNYYNAIKNGCANFNNLVNNA